MNKSVLISVHPTWCAAIAHGKKTIEVRKSRPKLAPPFKCYIYQTLPKSGDWNDMDGRVVAEFICDYIERYVRVGTSGSPRTYYRKVEPGTFLAKDIDYKATCLTPNEFADYGNGKVLYGWHINDFKLYDTPKPLSDFREWTGKPANGWYRKPLTRAPQSWQYVIGEDDS